MAGVKRDVKQVEFDRVRITELYLESRSQAEIARALEVSQSTVSREIAAIRKAWLESPLRNYNEAILRELAVIDRTEEQANSAWEASREKSKKTRMTKRDLPPSRLGGKAQTETEFYTESEERNGDPRYLEIILKCSEARSRLLGLIRDPQEGQGAAVVGIATMSPMLRVIQQAQRRLPSGTGNDETVIG